MKKSLLGLALAVSVAPSAYAAKKYVQAETVPGEIIVKLKADKARSFLSRKSRYGLQVKELLNLSSGNLAVFKSSLKSLSSTLEKLNNDPAVEYAEPNYLYRAIGTKKFTADPKFQELWGLINTGDNEPAGSRGNSAPTGKAGNDINAKEAWKITKGDKKIKIAVIDTGVDYNHPDLKNNMWTNIAEKNGRPGVDDDGNGYIDDIHGWDAANNDGDPMDGNGHGTHCAGTIAAEHDNNIGIAGVMAKASIVGVKFLTDQGSGSTVDAIKAIEYATKVKVDIMSNSWGGGGSSEALKDAIISAKNAGIIFTAAAGNAGTDNDSQPHYPSNYDVENVISVAAHNYNNELAYFSCYGKKTVHVAAPGRNILSTTPNNSYDVYSGTSMATPHVTGVIGLYLAEHGRTPATEITKKLMESSVYGKSYAKKIKSKGRVDAYNFLSGIVASRPYEPQPSEWESVSESHESIHPYGDAANTSKTFTIPGARYLRVVFEKIDMESNYDFVMIKDANGETVDKITGAHNTYTSEYLEGSSLSVGIESDSSVSNWGFKIKEIQFVK
jgi:subtilisin family serine protease